MPTYIYTYYRSSQFGIPESQHTLTTEGCSHRAKTTQRCKAAVVRHIHL
uniref:Uncharacterized protein n=1 Tax=Arundo donax TaxID=35708 RepID=A0A0A8ZVM5_ARUDO